MKTHDTLDRHLKRWAGGNKLREMVALTVSKLCSGAVVISALVAQGELAGTLGEIQGDNADGDAQKALDIIANDILVDEMRDSPVAYVASEEIEKALELNAGAPLSIAFDPLDGSSNIDTNLSVGTIFSIFETGMGNGTTDS